MTQFAFGRGTLIGKRTDVTGTPPCLLGTLDTVSLDFDRKIETLLGQYAMAVAAGGGEFKITGKATFVEDFGAFYAATGQQLSPVASSPTQGQYSVASGVYSFNTADNAAAVLIYYSYTVASGNKITLANQLMGPTPMFEVSLK